MVGVAQRLYHERVIDHYENPRNVGSLDKNATDVGTGLVGAPACGDVMVRHFGCNYLSCINSPMAISNHAFV